MGRRRRKRREKKLTELTAKTLRVRVSDLEERLRVLGLEMQEGERAEAAWQAAEVELDYPNLEAEILRQEQARLGAIQAVRSNYRLLAWRNRRPYLNYQPNLLKPHARAECESVVRAASAGSDELHRRVEARALEILGSEYTDGKKSLSRLREQRWQRSEAERLRRQLSEHRRALEVVQARDRPRIEQREALRAARATLDGRARQAAATVKRNLKRTSRCPYCGGKLGRDAHADHIYPVALGGQSRSSNMVFVCAKCNAKKRDKTLREFVELSGLDRSAVEERLIALGKKV